MKKGMYALIFGSALFLAACGSDDSSTAGETTERTGEQIVIKSCSTCHGGQLQGRGSAPALNDVGSRLTEEEILDIIHNGTGKGMPGGLVKGEEAEKAAEWLAQQK